MTDGEKMIWASVYADAFMHHRALRPGAVTDEAAVEASAVADSAVAGLRMLAACGRADGFAIKMLEP